MRSVARVTVTTGFATACILRLQEVLDADPLRLAHVADAGAAQGERELADGGGEHELLRVLGGDLDGNRLRGLRLRVAVGELIDGEHAHVLQQQIGVGRAFAALAGAALVRVSMMSMRSSGCTSRATPSTSSTRMVMAFLPSSMTTEREARWPGPVIFEVENGLALGDGGQNHPLVAGKRGDMLANVPSGTEPTGHCCSCRAAGRQFGAERKRARRHDHRAQFRLLGGAVLNDLHGRPRRLRGQP